MTGPEGDSQVAWHGEESNGIATVRRFSLVGGFTSLTAWIHSAPEMRPSLPALRSLVHSLLDDLHVPLQAIRIGCACETLFVRVVCAQVVKLPVNTRYVCIRL